MKKFFSRNTIIAFIIGILIGPGIALAQLTVPQGGTGLDSIANGSILFKESGSLRLATSSALQFDSTTGKLTVTNASTTNATIGGYLSFDGVVGTSWTDFCTTITGSADLCDGSDATGAGGSGLATSTAIADTYVIYGTSASDVGAEAAFTYDDATNKLTFGYGSSTAFSATTLFGALVGNADTATALASNGANCSAGSFPLGVDASGAVESCTDVWTEAENTAAAYLDSSDIGVSVQGYDADLATIAGLTEADSTFIVGTGAGWTTESGATVRTSLGLGSLATLSTINNSNWSGTDLSVANGGTGASTFTAGGVLYGNGTSAFSNSGVLTNGQLLIGDGTTFPTVATLTQGTGMTITNGAGSITLATTLGTSIAAAEIDNDTITNAQIDDADQTTTMCIYIEDPTADDDLKSIWANKTANDFLLTEMWAESDQTVNLDLQVDDGTPADVNGTDISPAAGEAEDTTLSGDTTVAAGEELDLAITSVSGTPTWVSICWTGNWVD